MVKTYWLVKRPPHNTSKEVINALINGSITQAEYIASDDTILISVEKRKESR